jgi:hypothetical protein
MEEESAPSASSGVAEPAPSPRGVPETAAAAAVIDSAQHVRDFFQAYGEANRYTIHEVIGKGSYGVVCSATDNNTKEQVRPSLDPAVQPLYQRSAPRRSRQSRCGGEGQGGGDEGDRVVGVFGKMTGPGGGLHFARRGDASKESGPGWTRVPVTGMLRLEGLASVPGSRISTFHILSSQ